MSKSSDDIGLEMLYPSLAQTPKSIILQRSEQKGRNGLLGLNSERDPHSGHGTRRFFSEDMVCVTNCRA